MGYGSHQKRPLQLIFIVLLCNNSALAITASTLTSTSVTSSTSSSTTRADDDATTKSSDKMELLDPAETKDPQKLEIVKQIRKYNNDGSYTVGYEAEDGTFKIESRDVLGNVKGTYGYVDENGEIRRVSYTANNGTGLKTGASEEQATTLPVRINRTSMPLVSSTRRPYSSVYGSSSTNSPTRSSVIQAIPRRRILFPSSTERSSRYHETSTSGPTTTVVYATSYHSSPRTPLILRPTPMPIENKRMSEQIIRPEKKLQDRLSPVFVAGKETTKTEAAEKSDEKKAARGNNLRRQLNSQQSGGEAYEQPQRHVIYSQSDAVDSSSIYGPNSGTTRQIYTTTSSPRVPVTVLAARQRAAHIQNLIANSPTSTTEKPTYVTKPSKRPEATLRTNDHTTESTSEHYLTQSPVPVVQIPANQDVTEAAGDERRVYRQRPLAASILNEQLRNRENGRYFGAPQTPTGGQRGPYRFPPQYDPQYQQDHEQYLREITPASIRGSSTIAPVQEQSEHQPAPFRSQRRPVPAQYDQEQDRGYSQGQQSYPIPYPINPYRSQYHSPYYPNDYQDRPLTARDFERLLQILILRHQQLQALNYRFGAFTPTTINPYFQGPSQYPSAYGSNNLAPYGGYQQIPRPPFDAGVYYDPRYAYSPSQPPRVRQPYQNQEAGAYQPGQNPAPSTQENVYDVQRMPSRKPYYLRDPPLGLASTAYPNDQEYATAQNHQQLDFLPADVRENLLYRMLMLAIQPDDPLDHVPAPTETHSTTTPIPKYFKKPVRSVQILGEE